MGTASSLFVGYRFIISERPLFDCSLPCVAILIESGYKRLFRLGTLLTGVAPEGAFLFIRRRLQTERARTKAAREENQRLRELLRDEITLRQSLEELASAVGPKN